MAAVEQSSLPQRHDGHHLAGASVELHTEAFSQSLSSCLTASCVESPKQLAASDPRPRRSRCYGKTGRRGRCHRSTRAARRGVQLEPDRLNVTVMVAADAKEGKLEAVLPPVTLPSSDESLVYRVTAATLNEMTGALAGCPHR